MTLTFQPTTRCGNCGQEIVPVPVNVANVLTHICVLNVTAAPPPSVTIRFPS